MQTRINVLLQERCFENSTYPFKMVDVLVFSVVTLFAVLARISLFPYESLEYTNYVGVLFNTLKANGGLLGVGSIEGNFTPAYTYLLGLLSYLPINPLFSIKIVSSFFDVILAFTVFRILMGITKSVKVSLCGYTAILLSPTIMLNSSAWGAYDSIFVTFILLCLFYFMKNRPFVGTIFFSIAFAFKLQAIFFAPMLILMWLKNRTRVKYFAAIPIIYLISVIPAFLAGRSILDLLLLYVKTAIGSGYVKTNSPSFYFLMGDGVNEYITVMGIFICGALVLLAIYLLYSKIFRFVPTAVVTISLLFTLMIPYFLPHMNERHFYLAEVLAILFAFCRPHQWFVAVLVNVASFVCYMPALFGSTDVNLFYSFAMMTTGLIFVGVDLADQIVTNGAKVQTKQSRPKTDPAGQAQAHTPLPKRVVTPTQPPVARTVEQPVAMTEEEEYYEEEERRPRNPLPPSSYSLSHEALAKQIPSIADVIEVKPTPLQQLQMEQMEEMQQMQQKLNQQNLQMQYPPQEAYQTMEEPAIPASFYEQQTQNDIIQQAMQTNPYAQQIAENLFPNGMYNDEAIKTHLMQEEQMHNPQYPLGKSQRLASDKTPPFTLSQRGLNERPTPPPPPAASPVVPKMTKSEMIAREMELPRKNRSVPKQYLQQIGEEEYEGFEDIIDNMEQPTQNYNNYNNNNNDSYDDGFVEDRY